MAQIFAPVLNDLGSAGAGTSIIEIGKGLYARLACTAATRTIGAPVIRLGWQPPNAGGADARPAGASVPADVLVGGLSGPSVGTVLLVEVINNSGGVLTVTWNAAFRGAPANPANGQRRIHQFIYDGTSWILMANAADVPS